MAQQNTFDIVSRIEHAEVVNAVDQAMKGGNIPVSYTAFGLIITVLIAAAWANELS